MKDLQPIIKELEYFESCLKIVTPEGQHHFIEFRLARIRDTINHAEFTYMQGLRER